MTLFRLYPSLRVKDIKKDELFAAIGFPSAKLNPEHAKRGTGKSEQELRAVDYVSSGFNEQHFSGKSGQLVASVGQAQFFLPGRLFREMHMEMIGVQNVASSGLSGGPLISMDDHTSRFVGIGLSIIFSRRSNTVAHALNGVGGSYVGTFYLTVDNPSVIATYLQFVLPGYMVGTV